MRNLKLKTEAKLYFNFLKASLKIKCFSQCFTIRSIIYAKFPAMAPSLHAVTI